MKIDYSKTLKVRGYRKPVGLYYIYNSDSNVRVWWKAFYPNITTDQHRAIAKEKKAKLEKLSVKWLGIVDKETIRIDKRHWHLTDYKISGIGRDDFSESVKDKLRAIVKEESETKIALYAHLVMLPKADRLKITK